MSLPLLRKEAREHGIVLGAAFAIAALALSGWLNSPVAVGGRFTGLAFFLWTIEPLLALVLANRLFVREYTGRTQFFLETLPIGRARTFATKWLLGCGLMLLTAWLAWLATLRFARRTEVLASSDAVGALLCSLTFCATVWSFAALAGMLGRYRYIAWAAIALAAIITVNVAGIPFSDLPVLRLLGQDVQMADALPETSAFVYSLAIAAACAAGAAALALVGSGAMASTLAGRMTARERVFVLVTLIVVGTISFTLEPKPVRPPFQITQGERFEGRWTRVGVLSTATFDAAAARRLARAIAEDTDALIEALGVGIHPPVFVLPQQGLDRHVMQRASLGGSDGIVLKVAPNAPAENVRMLVLHSLLADATLGRGMKEDRHVLLDGLSVFWAVRADEQARERWWLRAAAVPEPLPVDRLTAWAATSERFGECESLAIAYSVFDTLVQRVGRDAALRLMREIFVPPPENVGVLFEPRPATALANAGVDWPGLAAAAADARAAARERHAEALARRPTVTATVDWRSTPAQGIAIETTLSGAPRYAAYYRALSPWTADVGDMSRLEVLGSSAVLPLSPSRNARVLTVIEVEDEILDCPVRVLAERLAFR
jgi:hypothetical protein